MSGVLRRVGLVYVTLLAVALWWTVSCGGYSTTPCASGAAALLSTSLLPASNPDPSRGEHRPLGCQTNNTP